jgi:hypothetical protein
MPPPDDLSDDFVAEQLKKDAKENRLKYSSIGVEAFLPQRYGVDPLEAYNSLLQARESCTQAQYQVPQGHHQGNGQPQCLSAEGRGLSKPPWSAEE